MEVIMAKLTEEAKNAIGTMRPAYVATASKTGKPNVSAKGSVRVLDDEHVVFADVHSPRTIANIKENPQVSILWLDVATRKGCRIWGKGEIISSGELFDKTAAMLASRNMKINAVVKVTVEQVETN
jgi:predicted pyridoxine 5'-phosphate oxidase superfamily flavin-nucleotide-binding protein